MIPLSASGFVRSVFCVLCLVLAVTFVPRTVGAHPFGASSVNRYLGFTIEHGEVRVAWVFDLAELPSMVELDLLDPDHDGAVKPEEQERWLDQAIPKWTSGWKITLDGASVRPSLVARRVESSEGQSGATTLRVLAEFHIEIPARTVQGAMTKAQHVLHVVDTTMQQRAGWRELRAEDSPDAKVTAREIIDGASVPVADPEQAGTRTARMDEATFSFEMTAAPASSAVPARSPKLFPVRWVILGLSSLFALALAVILVRVGGLAGLTPAARLLVLFLSTLSISGVRDGAWLALAMHGGLVALLLASGVGSGGGRSGGGRSRGGRSHGGRSGGGRWHVRRLLAATLWAGALGLVLVPASGVTHAVLVALRVWLAMGTAIAFAAATTEIELAVGLTTLRLPGFFVSSVGATLRGFVLLRSEVERLSRARQLRAPQAGFATRFSMLSVLMATMLERGFARAARSHLAMTLRGVDGRVISMTPGWNTRSVLAVALCLLFGVGLRWVT